MRIALCLHGLCSGKSDFNKDVDYKLSYKNYVDKLFKPYAVDVFYHTWSPKGYSENQAEAIRQDLNKLYRPKKSHMEKQIIFHNDIISDKPQKIHVIKSRWYSAKQVITLKSEYEKANNFSYDFIFLSRFDLVMSTQFKFEELDKEKFYVSAGWGNGESVLDLWFIANSNNMNLFATHYDYLDTYGAQFNGNWCIHRLCGMHIKNMNLDLASKYLQFQDFNIARRIFETQYDHVIDKTKIIM